MHDDRYERALEDYIAMRDQDLREADALSIAGFRYGVPATELRGYVSEAVDNAALEAEY